ncbi:hypothetical protein WH390_07295 [Candidatus Arsenophonus nilaparvatae]|uniref:hypothetical protein n=1 Tax=Arsenophonus TaxID=637 RepID=UPI00050951AE|nr:hypothetical protein [Candidatus Arsenophonus nilaparvatae]
MKSLFTILIATFFIGFCSISIANETTAERYEQFYKEQLAAGNPNWWEESGKKCLQVDTDKILCMPTTPHQRSEKILQMPLDSYNN